MDIFVQRKTIQEDVNINSLTNLKQRKRRVAAYVRVSTLHEDQEHSYDSQCSYFYNLINSNGNWEFVDIYSDEGISGTSTSKRRNFMRMMEDAINDKMDLILVKSISRFCRNTVDLLKWLRLLKENDVGVFFIEENIYTLGATGNFIITVLASVAQQESENLSSHVRLAYKMKRQRGEIVGTTVCFGYRYVAKNKKIVVNKKESIVVKEIFRLFLEGKNYNQITNIIKDKFNIKITNIKNLLMNEKYTGDLLQGKYITINIFSRKLVRNTGQEDMYLIKNHHEPIIDRETFNKAQEEIKRRYAANMCLSIKNKIPEMSNQSSFRRKCICGYCGSFFDHYFSNNNKEKSKIICNHSFETESRCDKSKQISEDLLKEISYIVMKKLKLRLNKNDEEDVLQNLNHTKKILSKYQLTEEFNMNVFSELVEYIIIGNENSNDKYGPFNIRYILCTKKKLIIDPGSNRKNVVNSKYNKILEFTYKSPFHYYEKINNKKNLVIIDCLPVSVEYNPLEVV